MTNELKPCPFCNGVAELEERNLHAWEHGGAFAVRCSQCRMGDEGFYFAEAAVNKWNTRAIEQASQQQTDRAALADLVKTARNNLEEGRHIEAEAMLQIIESALSTPATEQANTPHEIHNQALEGAALAFEHDYGDECTGFNGWKAAAYLRGLKD